MHIHSPDVSSSHLNLTTSDWSGHSPPFFAFAPDVDNDEELDDDFDDEDPIIVLMKFLY